MSEITPSSPQPSCENAFEIAYNVLYLPIWTFGFGLFFIVFARYLKNKLMFTYYDNCNKRNAHFKYFIEVMVGPHTRSYQQKETSLILDFFDNSMSNIMTIQIFGRTIFRTNKNFLTRSNPRENLYLIKFVIYKKTPLKEIKCLKIAHTCGKPEALIFVYGVDLFDATNGERHFFPIPGPVKYRATHWAQASTYGQRNESNFRKLGCDSYDQLDLTPHLNYLDMLFLAYLLYGFIFMLCLYIHIELINSLIAHIILIGIISLCTVAITAYLYWRFIKSHVQNRNNQTYRWTLGRLFALGLILSSAFACWLIVYRKLIQLCLSEVKRFLPTPLWCSLIVTVILALIYYYFWRRKMKSDQIICEALETETLRSMKGKTSDNNADKLSVGSDQSTTIAKSPIKIDVNRQAASKQQIITDNHKLVEILKNVVATDPKPIKSAPALRETVKTVTTQTANVGKRTTKSNKRKQSPNNRKEDFFNEAIDRAYSSGSETYVKTRNPNSISQYV